MSQKAFEAVTKAQEMQHKRNEARNIRAKVSEAQKSLESYALRWPFELLQNALDAGPREGETTVSICIRCEQAALVFEHNGAPFTSQDLVALLSGGSNKEYESNVTTGRFGTGFLATHVLAGRVDLEGLIKLDNSHENFNLRLDRGGDEKAILDNIDSCNSELASAKQVVDIAKFPSAKFKYFVAEDRVLLQGLSSLKISLPYLYATRPRLGKVEIVRPDCREQWVAGDIAKQEIEGGCLEYRSIHFDSTVNGQCELQIYRFTSSPDTAAAALVLVEKKEGSWTVRIPSNNEPRVYREYPLRESGFVPVDFVIDGKFVPDQERSKLLMVDVDKELLSNAFLGAAAGAKYAIDQKWKDAHLLAHVSRPTRKFDPNSPHEGLWWEQQLLAFAERLASLPLVERNDEFLPAIPGFGRYADFVFPRLMDDSDSDETTVARMWFLVNSAKDLFPPREELAQDWTNIANGWYDIGLKKINRVSLARLSKIVRDKAQTMEQLNVNTDQRRWLASFLDLVGECWSKRKGTVLSVLDGILPNQDHKLCSPADLRRDSGISEQIKDISAEAGLDIRNMLFVNDLHGMIVGAGFDYLGQVVIQAIGSEMGELDVAKNMLEYLDKIIPEGKDRKEDGWKVIKASAKLIGYLWQARGQDAAVLIRKIPLITEDEYSVRWNNEHMMMAPICSWHSLAKPFSSVYSSRRVLSSIYVGDEQEGVPNCIPALVNCGIAYADPLITLQVDELKGRQLKHIALADSTGIAINNEKFSQIALIEDIIKRCGDNIEIAKAFFGLIVCYISRQDLSWQQRKRIKGRKDDKEVDLEVSGAMWLAYVKFRAWVPIPDAKDEDKTESVTATYASLQGLLDRSWLKDNDSAIKLLSEHFSFDGLDLQLLGLTDDSAMRREIRDRLASLVEICGDNPEIYTALAASVELKKQRGANMARYRLLGLAVQEAIKEAVEAYGLKLEFDDRGYDYRVIRLVEADDFEDASVEISIGSHLLEVKATTSGAVRMTPLQAKTSAEQASRYSLCVVDLRRVPENELDLEWTAGRVEGLAKIVTGIGTRTQETYSLVGEAVNSDVGIRNETALRYEVPVAMWEPGIAIAEWVKTLAVQERAS